MYVPGSSHDHGGMQPLCLPGKLALASGGAEGKTKSLEIICGFLAGQEGRPTPDRCETLCLFDLRSSADLARHTRGLTVCPDIARRSLGLVPSSRVSGKRAPGGRTGWSDPGWTDTQSRPSTQAAQHALNPSRFRAQMASGSARCATDSDPMVHSSELILPARTPALPPPLTTPHVVTNRILSSEWV